MPHQLKLRIFISSCLLLAGAVSVFAQDAATIEILTNERVITMVQAGLQPTIIINKIRASKTNFNISTDELIRLKQARVPDDVVNVMINPNLGLAANAAGAADNGYPKEIGVYLKKDNQWLE